MPDTGLLITLPAQSVAVRLLLGAVIAVVAARLLLQAGLRVPRVRVGAALVPAAALVAILAVSLGHYRLPTVMVPNGGAGSVLVPIENTYAYLAPLALPALLGGWALVVVIRVGVRLRRVSRLSRHAARAVSAGETPPMIRCAVHRVAARMGIDAPPVALADECSGGASVVGIRRPTVVVDADLASRLDPHELEGVIAHELAHVRRRDNLVALLFSITRDLVFFVPGGRWALRQLLVEREIAADQLAIETTNRPGALAGGLLKVLEGAGEGHACAALLPNGTLVRRVNHLVDERPGPTRLRVTAELTTLAAALTAVVVGATLLPHLATGNDPDGGLGVLFTAPQPEAPAPATEPAEPRIFATYRGATLRTTPAAGSLATVLDDDIDAVRPATLAACAAGDRSCTTATRAATLALRPQPSVRVEDGSTMRWHAHPVVDTGNVLRIYWLSTIR